VLFAPSETPDSDRFERLERFELFERFKALHANWQFTTLAAFFERGIERIPGGLNGSRKFRSGGDYSAR